MTAAWPRSLPCLPRKSPNTHACRPSPSRFAGPSLSSLAERGLCAGAVLAEIRLVREQQHEQRLRLSSLERAVAQIGVDVAQINARLDRVHDRIPDTLGTEPTRMS